MNVEIETEAAQFPEKEYINGIFVAVAPGATNHMKKWKSHNNSDLFKDI